jgi:hypothetical protein
LYGKGLSENVYCDKALTIDYLGAEKSSHMKKAIKYTGISLAAVLLLLQFYRPARNQSNGTLPSDIVMAYGVPENVATVLHKACYDCHSNNTHYPWYANVQPVGMWLGHHVDEGKEELNFSEFGNFKAKRKLHKLQEIVEQIEEGEMPLSSYTIIHKEAVLTAEEKQLLTSWARGLSQRITIESATAGR